MGGGSPHVNPFHRWLDLLRYCGQVSEGAVHFSGHIAGAGAGTATAPRQQEQPGQDAQGPDQPGHGQSGEPWDPTFGPLRLHNALEMCCGETQVFMIRFLLNP